MNKRVASIIGGVALGLLPTVVFAATQNGGLVPCTDGISCNVCDFYKLAQNIINFLIELSIPIAVLLFAYAGALYFTSGAKPDNIGRARKIFSSAFIGFMIAISGWLVVQTIINVLVKKEFQMNWTWNSLDCSNISRPGVTGRPITVSDWLNGVLGNLNAPLQSTTPPPTGGNGDLGLNTAVCTGLMQQALNNLGNGATIDESKICREAEAWAALPQSTASGPDGGNEACVWSVNGILQKAIKLQDGNLVSTIELENELHSIKAQQISAPQAQCGDIVFSASEPGGPEHVGICANTGCTQIISNSSTFSIFAWCSDQNFCMTHSCLGLGNIYKVP